MKNKSLIMTIAVLVIVLKSAAQITGTFSDPRDGKAYRTVTIGTQTWMAENLSHKTSSGCWAYNDSISYVAKYGYLYNWETAKTACPKGWHLPTDAEWTTLTTYLGGETEAGGKLKESGTTHWTSPNANLYATNETNFTALPGGVRSGSGTFHFIEDFGYWWSSTEDTATNAWNRSMVVSLVIKNYAGKSMGLSVRCVRDK
jgi:uncharacterized protein (TIGR02145 family)